MHRLLPLLGVLVVALTARPAVADTFDHYLNPVLAKAPGAPGVLEISQLTPALIAEHDRVLPGITGAFLLVKTNEGRWSKAMVQAARQKVDATVANVGREVRDQRSGQQLAGHRAPQKVRPFSATS